MSPPRTRRGAIAVEFALVLPVLLLLVVGAIDWGWLFVQQAAVVVCARDGAHAGALAAEDAQAAADARARGSLMASGFVTDPGDVQVRVYEAPPGEVVEVRIAVPFDPVVGLVPTPDQLVARTTMLREGA